MTLQQKYKQEIGKMSDLRLGNEIVKYSGGSYREMLRDEAIARILNRLMK